MRRCVGSWMNWAPSDGSPSGCRRVKTPRLVVFGGGFPVSVYGAVIGGIGVGGGRYEQDMKVAESALAALQKAN